MKPKLEIVAGANAGRSRSHNRQVVLDFVRTAGQIGRAEIAKFSGLSTQAVSNIIADLQTDGLLLERGRLSSGRGLPAVQYALNPKGGYAFGFEVRPDALFVALLGLDGQCVFSRRMGLENTSPDHVRERIRVLQQTALDQSGIPANRTLGAGVVMPGPFGATGLSNRGSELQDWQDIDAKALFEDALGLSVHLENDANAAAMSEHFTGVAQRLKAYAYLYFGTGLGLGLVSNGRLMRGAFGNAGEIGHVMVQGNQGPIMLENAVSRLSAQTHLRDAGIHAASSEDLEALHAQSCPQLIDWIRATAVPLGNAVAIIENLFDPEVVILGGAMPEPILDQMIAVAALPERSVANRANRLQPRLIRGGSGRMTATLGAATLVISHTFTPQIAVQS